jgi:hypothetical protein
MAHSLAYRRILTRMGYYNYQNGLIYRHLNQDGGWEDHLKRSRQFIMKAVELYHPGKVTVLGSGWLLDFPFKELCERVKIIRLIDIVHPPDVIKQVAGFENVELLEQDVSGGLIDLVWQNFNHFNLFKKSRTLSNIEIPEYKQPEDPGLVISLNILTQLETLLVEFIKKRSYIKEDELNRFRTAIQEKHLEYLSTHKSVLISDYEEVVTSTDGSERCNKTLLTELPAYGIIERWNWNFDLKKADNYNSRSEFRVVALIT